MAIVQELQFDNIIPDQNQMAELTGYGLIEAVGEDAKSFLLGLSTSDVKQVSPSYSQYSGICDTKGRVLTSFIIFNRDGAYYLFLPKDMVETVIKKLKMHVLRAKVTLSDKTDQFKLVGLSGNLAGDSLTKNLELQSPIDTQGQTAHSGDYTVIKLPGQAQPRWLVVSSNEAFAALQEKLSAEVVSIDKDSWDVIDAISGLAFIVPSTAGEYLPQMLNMEAMGGLSFTKGCYPGQEVIARLHYRGKLKRRLYVACAETETLPEAGMQLFHPGDPTCIGHVLSAVRHTNGQVVLQAVIEIEQKDQGEVALASPEGSRLRFMIEN